MTSILARAIIPAAVAVGMALTAVPASAAPAGNDIGTMAVCTHYSYIPVVGGGSAAVPTIGSGTGNVNCTLSQGTNSPGVRALQSTLNVCYLVPTGRTPLVLDGDFGPRTRAALVFTQGMAGAVPDGVYGPETRRKILWDRQWGSAFCNHLAI